MARKPMVTRTIQSTYCSVLCADTEKGEMFNKEIILPRTYKDDKAMLKAACKALETETVKPVAIATSSVRYELYGMDEDFFINNATILDPETRKAYENNAEAETATSSN